MIELPLSGGTDRILIQPTKIIALGLNYRDHIAESHSVKVSGFTGEIPDEPVLFPKTPNVLVGPDEPIILPAFLSDYQFEDPRTDYEAELAMVIANRCRHVPREQAMDQILGFTCFNDVSQRNLQTKDRSGWFRGKSLDTFGPIGPRIVRPEDIGDPRSLRIQCRLNGKTVQDSSTRFMIFPIPDIIAFVSRQFTLMPGDIIATGTPSGVGRIQDGDVVEVEIESIGVLRNPVIQER